ncbi:MAG: histidine kinase [Bacteroidota bacterium]|nr:histidine kinase [Bacteroidota bacterium]
MTSSPLSSVKFRVSFFGWWLVWSILHVLLIMNYGFVFRTALFDSIITNGLMQAACGLVINILRFYLPTRDRYWYVFLLSLILSLAVNALSKFLLNLSLEESSNTDYLIFLANAYWLRLAVAFLMIGCMSVICVLWYSQEEEQENRQRKNDAEKLSRDAELYKLRQQLQPHFLFNSLNSISALIGSDPSQARNMIHQLSDFLRTTLRKEEEQWVKVEEELQSLELYLEIEKVRFGHRLSTSIAKDNESLQMLIPPMLLQPVVENAIKFGLYDTTNDVTINISVSSEADSLKVIVRNPYDPETASPRHGTGFGLNSVKRRLYLLFARTDLVETSAKDQVFTTIINIPKYENYYH